MLAMKLLDTIDELKKQAEASEQKPMRHLYVPKALAEALDKSFRQTMEKAELDPNMFELSRVCGMELHPTVLLSHDFLLAVSHEPMTFQQYQELS